MAQSWVGQQIEEVKVAIAATGFGLWQEHLREVKPVIGEVKSDAVGEWRG